MREFVMGQKASAQTNDRATVGSRAGTSVASLLLATTAFLIAMPSVRAADTIKICVIDDLSGDFAIYGRPKHLGPELAVKEINAAGGVLGKKLEIVFYDGQSDVKRNQELAEKCVLDD